DADPRSRHRGVSHHSLTSFGRVALAGMDLAVPEGLPRELRVRVEDDLAAQPDRNRIVYVSDRGLLDALAASPVTLSTMGRGLDEDPWYFLAAAAAGRHDQLGSAHHDADLRRRLAEPAQVADEADVVRQQVDRGRRFARQTRSGIAHARPLGEGLAAALHGQAVAEIVRQHHVEARHHHVVEECAERAQTHALLQRHEQPVVDVAITQELAGRAGLVQRHQLGRPGGQPHRLDAVLVAAHGTLAGSKCEARSAKPEAGSSTLDPALTAASPRPGPDPWSCSSLALPLLARRRPGRSPCPRARRNRPAPVRPGRRSRIP
ncbi:MAG: DUF3866 family protein, partial [Planctomycetes bacterium]|nr:DUF3866 family protein [Planctomycetota bacterium]